MNAWLLSSAMTWAPIAVLLITVYVLIKYIESNVKQSQIEQIEQKDEYLKYLGFYSIKKLIILLILTFLYSMFNSANRPKYDVTPNQTYDQRIYEEQVATTAKKEIKKIKLIQDSFEENRERILSQFDYDKGE